MAYSANPLVPSFRPEAEALHRLLLDTARFDEAHWLELAMLSPNLCNCEYARCFLPGAASIAAEWGLSHVASWLNELAYPGSRRNAAAPVDYRQVEREGVLVSA